MSGRHQWDESDGDNEQERERNDIYIIIANRGTIQKNGKQENFMTKK